MERVIASTLPYGIDPSAEKAFRERVFPTGIIILMFTDIESHRKIMSAVGTPVWLERFLAPHNRILWSCLKEYGGTFVDGAGDGWFVVFSGAEQAVHCAAKMQRSINAEH